MLNRAALSFCLFGLLLVPAWANDEAQQPYQFIRSLRAVQDQIATGSPTAHVFQRKFLAQIAENLPKTPIEQWQDPRNARALAAFALSGGDPRVIRSLLGHVTLHGIEEKLVLGALAYAEGRNNEAGKYLLNIKARSMEPTIGAHLALIQSMLAHPKATDKIHAFLDDARLLAPGTLIEESALRRQILLLSGSSQYDRMERLSSQYLRRFANSVYAKGFRRQFASEIARTDFGAVPERLATLRELLNGLADSERRELYLAIAEEAIKAGKIAIVRFAAPEAAKLSAAASTEAARSNVYEAAALVVTNEFDRGLAMLHSISRARLSGPDAELLDAAKLVAAEIRRNPESTGPVEVPDPAAAERARKLITQVDDFLSGNTR